MVSLNNVKRLFHSFKTAYFNLVINLNRYLFSMKKSFFWLFPLLISACQQKDHDTQQLDALTYTMDTVTVDAKGEILDVKRSLGNSGITNDQQFLYNFNLFDHHLEKIDLNK